VCSGGEIRQDFFEGKGFGGLHEHIGHGRAEKDNRRFRKGCECFAFEKSGDGQPACMLTIRGDTITLTLARMRLPAPPVSIEISLWRAMSMYAHYR